MGSPYVGEIRMFAGNFNPDGWQFCYGQLLPISEYATLFNLIGTTYGGDGETTFALPNLGSRFLMHQGPGFVIGQTGGTETVTLTAQQIPEHTHPAECAAGGGNVASPAGAYWSTDPGGNTAAYSDSAGSSMSAAAIGNTGGGQAHENRQPYVAVNFIISLFGIFPSQS
jgi:microcystin-dependent protein